MTKKMPRILRLAAFSDGDQGGNPAGVVIDDELPSAEVMQEIAADVNYSETAFACPLNEDGTRWKVRYYSPKREVLFCGHATIALSAALAEHTGQEAFTLELQDAVITTSVEVGGTGIKAALVSPPTSSTQASQDTIDAFLDLFGLGPDDLDGHFPPAMINGGVQHLLLALNNRQTLAQMDYDIERGAVLMEAHDVVTVMMLWQEDAATFHVRNAFASGGVFEDPATGAAAAAFTGHMARLHPNTAQALTLIQGEDMGMRSLITTYHDGDLAVGVKVSGSVRNIEEVA